MGATQFFTGTRPGDKVAPIPAVPRHAGDLSGSSITLSLEFSGAMTRGDPKETF
jgi:hypothetical protein